MSFYLDLPFVTQLGIGAHVDPATARDDPTGCWYASLCMVGYYFEAGPRLGNPELFNKPLDKNIHGTDVGHFPIGGAAELKMMQNEGLEEVPEPADKKWKGWQLAKLLKEYGPLMMSWRAPGAHVSVVIGVDTDKNQVIYHDPENAPNSRMSLNDFNTKLMWGNRALIRRKGQPHQKR
ncbi:papain-like cysteine protease family protein [Methylomonas sp. 11b]|uniref:papain-like cysteine protease family protein n=1 Tax=Methylomonas sp. 11b TaxID=1168169 RepID=UPI000479F9DA|nr:papain-like cysteine protease family protein [Methylomonas sp. 11b]